MARAGKRQQDQASASNFGQSRIECAVKLFEMGFSEEAVNAAMKDCHTLEDALQELERQGFQQAAAAQASLPSEPSVGASGELPCKSRRLNQKRTQPQAAVPVAPATSAAPAAPPAAQAPPAPPAPAAPAAAAAIEALPAALVTFTLDPPAAGSARAPVPECPAAADVSGLAEVPVPGAWRSSAQPGTAIALDPAGGEAWWRAAAARWPVLAAAQQEAAAALPTGRAPPKGPSSPIRAPRRLSVATPQRRLSFA